MPSHTTVEIYSHLLNVMNKIGFTPIKNQSVTHSKSDALDSKKRVKRDKSGNPVPKGKWSNKTNCSSFTIENYHNRNTTFERNPEPISAFPIFRFENVRNKSPMFWIMLVFVYGTTLPSIYKLIVTLQATIQPKVTADGGHRCQSTQKGGVQTPVLVASFVWVVYAMTCCATYFVHFFKAGQVCRFLTKWQIVEGELITESKAINASGSNVESFIKWQRKGLSIFSAGAPFSFIFMGFATTYNPQFPMYIYSSVPPVWEENRPWIQPLCYIFAWIQVGLFLICESQTELITIAFTRSMYKCLKIMNQPATDFCNRLHKLHRFNSKSDQITDSEGITPKKNPGPNQKLEMLLLFYDSVERYESLNDLMNEFNSIFRWPLFIRKAFTMAKICCYVYLILRHPLDSAFPGFVVFLYGAVAIFLKFGGILSLMAAVRGESQKFLQEWERVLLILFPSGLAEEERRLARCSRLGFKIGNFYTVKSQTLLTFSSVVLTYLMILLQL